MDSLTASGLGSGLDIKALVDQLVAAERQAPNDRLNLAEARVNREVSSIGKLKSALAEFSSKLEVLSDQDSFFGREVFAGTEDIVSVTAQNSAATGTWSIEVTSLAAGQKIASQAFADTATAIGYGSLTIDVGGQLFEVEIDEGANTLNDIADALNDVLGDTGVAASIVTVDDGARLVLTGPPGASNEFSITASGGDGGLTVFDYAVGTPGAYTEIEAAADAVLSVDDFAVTSDSNSVTGVIEGVTIELLDTDPGNPFTISVTRDEAKAKLALTNLVAAYNKLFDTITSETAYDSETGASGALLGDSLTRRIQTTIRSAISSVDDDQTAAFRTFAEIGLVTTSAGRLEIDDARLTEAISADLIGIADMFSTDGRIGKSLIDSVEVFVESDGFIDSRQERLNGRLDELREARERLDERLEAIRERYQRQFNAMDLLVSQLSTTSQFLARQLG